MNNRCRTALRRPTPGAFRRRRRGAVLVEVAMIAPLVFLFIIGLMVAGVTSFRSHQVTALAREAARWASLHGPAHGTPQKNRLPSDGEIYDNAVKPLASSLDRKKLEFQVDWNLPESHVIVTVRYAAFPRILGRQFTTESTAFAYLVD